MNNRGFTLLEVLVATVIMAVAVVSLLANLSTSMQNAARLTDYDRAALMAKRTMDDLLTRPELPKGTVLEGGWDPSLVGFEGGWRARVTPFERAPDAGPGLLGMDRIELEVWWNAGDRRQTFKMDGFRAAVLTPADMNYGVVPQ